MFSTTHDLLKKLQFDCYFVSNHFHRIYAALNIILEINHVIYKKRLSQKTDAVILEQCYVYVSFISKDSIVRIR